MDKRPRGRPREYDRSDALRRAMSVFVEKGFSATSLDELSAITGMNRPSIYAAFGNKESFYREALAYFVAHLRAQLAVQVVDEPDLGKALKALYYGALDEYFSVRPSPGCFFFCTAPVEAMTHPEIQHDMKALMEELDALLEGKFSAALAAGEVDANCDVKSAAKIAQGILHSLALRARAGESKAALRRAADFAVALLTKSS